jgi:hypothetical protein
MDKWTTGEIDECLQWLSGLNGRIA